MAELKPGTWMMKGTVLIACNCDYGCPCNVNAPPTHGHCEGGWSWQIEQGSYGSARLDGLHLGLMCDWPKAIHEGDGVAVALIDERADEPQRAALRALVEGTVGGPWGTSGRPSASYTGRATCTSRPRRRRGCRARAGEAAVIETDYITNPLTQETIHPRIVLPEGLIVKEAALVGTKRFIVSDEHVRYDHSGHYGAYGFFRGRAVVTPNAERRGLARHDAGCDTRAGGAQTLRPVRRTGTCACPRRARARRAGER